MNPVGVSGANARSFSARNARGSIGGRLMLNPFSTGTKRARAA
jgi:hypothetical protein